MYRRGNVHGAGFRGKPMLKQRVQRSGFRRNLPAEPGVSTAWGLAFYCPSTAANHVYLPGTVCTALPKRVSILWGTVYIGAISNRPPDARGTTSSVFCKTMQAFFAESALAGSEEVVLSFVSPRSFPLRIRYYLYRCPPMERGVPAQIIEKMVAGGALDSQNRPSPVGQRPTDNPKDCRLCRNVDQASFFLLRLADRREAGSRGSPESTGLRRKSVCKARRKKDVCGNASMLTWWWGRGGRGPHPTHFTGHLPQRGRLRGAPPLHLTVGTEARCSGDH